jgi:hypothetical protein
MSGVVEAREAGWRPDPSGRYEWRYWDGGWTNRVANSVPNAQPARSARAALPAAPGAPAGAAPGATPRPAPRPQRFVSSAPSPGGGHTAPPPSASEMAVMAAVRSGLRAPPPAAPAALPPATAPTARAVREPRSGILGAISRWFRAFADEPESYHSPKAGVALPPHPNQSSILASTPANYGRAGLVGLAALGLGIGAYLPWLSGTIGAVPFERTGFELGRAWGFTWLAGALALAAILGVRMKPLRWANMALAVACAVLTAKELIEVHDLVESMNTGADVAADVGIGLWIMLVSAAGALIASFRIGVPE